jgi:hypothetical protein
VKLTAVVSTFLIGGKDAERMADVFVKNEGSRGRATGAVINKLRFLGYADEQVGTNYE